MQELLRGLAAPECAARGGKQRRGGESARERPAASTVAFATAVRASTLFLPTAKSVTLPDANSTSIASVTPIPAGALHKGDAVSAASGVLRLSCKVVFSAVVPKSAILSSRNASAARAPRLRLTVTKLRHELLQMS